MAEPGFDGSFLIKYAIIPAAAIIITLALLTKRARPNPLGHYIPALVVPMRFLDGYEHRWSYALSFGAITGVILVVFFSTIYNKNFIFCTTSSSNSTSSTGLDNLSVCDSVWGKSLLFQAQSMVGSLVCAPHFVCISTPHRLVGALMGWAYSTFWVAYYIVGAVDIEKYFGSKLGLLMASGDLPVFLCCIGLMVRSVWAIGRCYTTRTIRAQTVENLVEKHQVDHVTSLFRPPASPDWPRKQGYLQKAKVKVKDQLFPHFKLPTRVVCMAFVQVIIVYYMMVAFIILYQSIPNISKDGLTGAAHNIFGTTFRSIFEGVWVTSELVALLSSVVYIVLFVINYRRDMIQIYKGHKHRFPSSCSRTSPSTHVASSLRLPGYQIAYTVWGFIVVFQMVVVPLAIITFGIWFLVHNDLLLKALDYIVQLLSIPLIAIVFFYLQVLVVRVFLLQPKLNQEDKYHPLNVDNRHAYEVVAYTLVFINMLLGLGSALLRIYKSLLLGMAQLARLDKCLLMSGAESLDPAYMAYVSSLLVDNAHNNPTMRTFCALLVRLTSSPHEKDVKGIAALLEPAQTCTNSRASRRWHLAYTLLNNPDLLPRRKLALLLRQGISIRGGDGDDSPPAEDGFSASGGGGSSSSSSGIGSLSVKVHAPGRESHSKGLEISLQSVVG